MKIGVGYDVGVMKCDIDYYICFFDCEIWLLILDRMDGRDWEEVWKELESDGRFWKWWRVEVWGGGVVEGVVIATNAFRLTCAYIAIFWQCEVNFTFQLPPRLSGFFHSIMAYYHITKILCKP